MKTKIRALTITCSLLLLVRPFVAHSDTKPSPVLPVKLVNEATFIPGVSAKYSEYLFSNGLKLIVVPDTRNPLATLHFILNAGSNREHPGTTGLAHFFEHMMFRKTKNAPEGNYDRVLNSVGGSGNAGTSDSFVTFYSKFPAPALETMIRLESDRFINLDLSEPYFSTEKGAVISERKLRVENDPMQRSQEILRAITERATPMEWMTIGSKSDVENMSLQSTQKFYQDFYTPSNTTMIIGGPFEPSKVANLVGQFFLPWKGKNSEQNVKYSMDYFTRDLGKSFVCSAPVLTKRYQLVYPSSDNSLKSIVYSSLFQSVLDDNPEGTFERRLMKNKFATDFNYYKVYWQNQTNPITATFLLSKDEKFELAKEFWLKSIDDVIKTPIGSKIKNQVLKQMKVLNAQTAERMTSLVNTVLENFFFLHNLNALQDSEKMIKNVTTKDFKQWVQQNLGKNQFYTTGIVTSAEAKSCQEMYTEFIKNTNR